MTSVYNSIPSTSRLAIVAWSSMLTTKNSLRQKKSQEDLSLKKQSRKTSSNCLRVLNTKSWHMRKKCDKLWSAQSSNHLPKPIRQRVVNRSNLCEKVL